MILFATGLAAADHGGDGASEPASSHDAAAPAAPANDSAPPAEEDHPDEGMGDAPSNATASDDNTTEVPDANATPVAEDNATDLPDSSTGEPNATLAADVAPVDPLATTADAEAAQHVAEQMAEIQGLIARLEARLAEVGFELHGEI